MSLPIEATTEQIETTRAWIEAFYRACDSSDIQGWITEFCRPDAILNFRDLPPLKGHKEISDHFEKERAQLWSINHKIKHADVFFDRIYVQQIITSIVKNDPEQKEIKIKSMVLVWKEVDKDKLSSIDIYFDPTSLNERINMFSSK